MAGYFDKKMFFGKKLDIFLLCLIVVLLLCNITLAIFNQIYTDEISYLIIKNRFFYEGTTLSTLFPQCASSFNLTAPWSWYPSVFYRGILGILVTQPIHLRIIGLTYLTLIIGLATYLAVHLLQTKYSIPRILIAVLSFFSLGVFPYLLILARPEQELIIVTLLAVVFYYKFGKNYAVKNSMYGIAIVTLLIALSGFANSAHPRSLLFAPLLIYVTLHLTHKIWRIFVSAILAASYWESFSHYAKRTSCPELPNLNAALSHIAISPSHFIRDWYETLQTGIDNLLLFPRYVSAILFKENYEYGWLAELTNDVGVIVNINNFSIWLIAVVFFVFIVVKMLKSIIEPHKLHDSSNNFLPILYCLFFTFTGLIFLQNQVVFYESILILGLFGLIFLLTFARNTNVSSTISVKYSIFEIFLILTGISSSVISLTYVSLGNQNYINDMTHYNSTRRFSLPGLEQDVNKIDILLTAKSCELLNEQTAHRLLLDESTYLTLSKFKTPILFRYLLWQNKRSALMETIASINPSGIVVHCENFPKELDAIKLRHGDFCCAKFN